MYKISADHFAGSTNLPAFRRVAEITAARDAPTQHPALSANASKWRTALASTRAPPTQRCLHWSTRGRRLQRTLSSTQAERPGVGAAVIFLTAAELPSLGRLKGGRSERSSTFLAFRGTVTVWHGVARIDRTLEVLPSTIAVTSRSFITIQQCRTRGSTFLGHSWWPGQRCLIITRKRHDQVPAIGSARPFAVCRDFIGAEALSTHLKSSRLRRSAAATSRGAQKR